MYLYFMQGLCTAIAAILQYLFLVAFALMTVLSVTLYWKVSSFTRGMQTDKIRNTVISMVLAWGRKFIIPLHRPGHTFTQVISPGPHFCHSHYRSPYAVLSYITKTVFFHFNKLIFITLFQNMNFCISMLLL